jgi:D-glycero-D-manno-heptose 1,7-bisphosphate phosphatase
MRKCVFFDRDGIANESPGPGYVERWEDFRLLPSFVAALRMARARGYEGVVVTNQSGVAKGIMTIEAVERIHSNLRELLSRRHGLPLLDILFCPHADGQCDCRKPQPGMLVRAARRHGIDLAASWMVGDSERDIEAGRRAGCRTILVAPAGADTAADCRAGDGDDLVAVLSRVLDPVERAPARTPGISS